MTTGTDTRLRVRKRRRLFQPKKESPIASAPGKIGLEIRKAVHAPGSEKWEFSRLEGILEFFEKFALMHKLSGDMSFIYQSTVGWYAAHYFLCARQHGQIRKLRELWGDDVYQDLEHMYKLYLIKEVGRRTNAQESWEAKRLLNEDKFWKQERKE